MLVGFNWLKEQIDGLGLKRADQTSPISVKYVYGTNEIKPYIVLSPRAVQVERDSGSVLETHPFECVVTHDIPEEAATILQKIYEHLDALEGKKVTAGEGYSIVNVEVTERMVEVVDESGTVEAVCVVNLKLERARKPH